MIYRYQKVRTSITDYTISGDGVTELATVDGWTYVATDDVLPPQSNEVEKTLESVELTDELKTQIAAASPIVQHIREVAAAKIQAALPMTDELKLLRNELAAIMATIGAKVSTAYADGDAKVKAIQLWSAAEKAKLGL